VPFLSFLSFSARLPLSLNLDLFVKYNRTGPVVVLGDCAVCDEIAEFLGCPALTAPLHLGAFSPTRQIPTNTPAILGVEFEMRNACGWRRGTADGGQTD